MVVLMLFCVLLEASVGAGEMQGAGPRGPWPHPAGLFLGNPDAPPARAAYTFESCF